MSETKAGRTGARDLPVTFDSSLSTQLEVTLRVLADAGVTGSVEMTGDDSKWKIVLAAGKVADLDAMVYYPGERGSDAEVLCLTRREIRALLELVVGGQPDDLAQVVKRLSDALN